MKNHLVTIFGMFSFIASCGHQKTNSNVSGESPKGDGGNRVVVEDSETKPVEIKASDFFKGDLKLIKDRLLKEQGDNPEATKLAERLDSQEKHFFSHKRIQGIDHPVLFIGNLPAKIDGANRIASEKSKSDYTIITKTKYKLVSTEEDFTQYQIDIIRDVYDKMDEKNKLAVRLHIMLIILLDDF